MGSEIIVVIVVATALIFDFTHGFHDTANVVATSISTRAMPPRVAVGYAAILNFVGAFISLEVAATVAKDVVSVQSNSVGLLAVFAGLVGAIAWNLITWYFGLPSSSSHALIGGMVGAVFVAEGADNVNFFRIPVGVVIGIPDAIASSTVSPKPSTGHVASRIEAFAMSSGTSSDSMVVVPPAEPPTS